MADAIGVASGLLTLATFAFQASISLYNTIQSFQSHPKRVRDLIDELQALSGVLGPLKELVSATTDVDLSALEIPLRRCGKACEEFEEEIQKCSSRSSKGRTSFRDWAKLQYMGDDIDGFRRLLAGYQLTINIALTDANLRKSSITAESIESYKDLVKTATDDLEARLESIDEKFEAIVGQAVTKSDSYATELQLIKEERLATEKCLQICRQLSDHINQIQLIPKRSGSSGSVDPEVSPEKVINEGLQECKNSLAYTAARLERHMKDVLDRLVSKSETAMTSEDRADLVRLRDEWEATRQCVDICSKANTNLKESISIIENYATGDALQFMVSTNDKIIHGKNRGLGWRSRQVGGHLSDDTVQQISRDMSGIVIQRAEHLTSSPRGNTPPVPGNGMESKPSSEFRDRYGPGFKLTTKSTSDKATTSSGRGDAGPSS